MTSTALTECPSCGVAYPDGPRDPAPGGNWPPTGYHCDPCFTAWQVRHGLVCTAPEGCNRRPVARGMCKRHWTQWRRGRLARTEPAVHPVTGATPEHCHRCSALVCADITADPATRAIARQNHARYCPER